ncbi:hypothetical protein GQ457_18G014020 [Hibiscus cannabinus]
MENKRMTDLGWNYCYLTNPTNKNNVTCKYCSIVFKGGIYKFKHHLASGYRNIKGCIKSPEHVGQEIIEYFLKKKQE